MARTKGTRTKRKPIAGARGQHYNGYDPFVTYPTKAAARLAERNYPGKQILNVREATLYTFCQYRSRVLPTDPFLVRSIPQGPHTFPHHGVISIIRNARKNGRLAELASKLPTPEAFSRTVRAEIPEDHIKSGRARAAEEYYQKLYGQLQSELKTMGQKQRKGLDTQEDQARISSLLNRGFQVQPYQTYAYKGKGASRSAINGHGENPNKPIRLQIAGQFGTPFHDMKAARSWSNRLARILEGK